MTNHNNAAQAIQEAERIAAADEYFKARTWLMDTNDNRRIFEAGFDRAYALLSKLRAPVAVERAALEWYAEHVAGCRKLGPDGDAARQALDKDGGERARAALASAPVADERCKRCGGPGWYTSHTTGYPESLPCSASNPQGVSLERLEKDPFLAAQLWRKPADTDGSLLERILEHVSEYGESMASSSLPSVRTIARRNLEARIGTELEDAMRSQDESPLREALSEIASAWSVRTRMPEEDGVQALKDIARAALASAPSAGQQPIVHQHGFAADNQRLRAINESLDKQLEEVMTERDNREDVIDKLLDIVLGANRSEWSSEYDYGHAVIEVEERMHALVSAPVAGEALPDYMRDLRYHVQYRIGWNHCVDAYRAALSATQPEQGERDA